MTNTTKYEKAPQHLERSMLSQGPTKNEQHENGEQ